MKLIFLLTAYLACLSLALPRPQEEEEEEGEEEGGEELVGG
jgi:hypothetical protein